MNSFGQSRTDKKSKLSGKLSNYFLVRGGDDPSATNTRLERTFVCKGEEMKLWSLSPPKGEYL